MRALLRTACDCLKLMDYPNTPRYILIALATPMPRLVQECLDNPVAALRQQTRKFELYNICRSNPNDPLYEYREVLT